MLLARFMYDIIKISLCSSCKKERLEVVNYIIFFTGMYVTQSPDLDSVQRPEKVNFRLYPTRICIENSFGS